MNIRDETNSAGTPAAFCETKLGLLEQFQAAVRELNLLHTEQMRAAVDDDPEFGRFDLLIHLAQEKKDKTKYALISHVTDHGCMIGNVTFS